MTDRAQRNKARKKFYKQFVGQVNRKNSVPWLAGASTTPTGFPVNIDFRVPETITVKGKTFPPDKYLVVHEIVEYKHMTKGGMKYEPAHRKALHAEKAAVEADGIDWNGYQEAMHRIAEGLEKAKHPNPPKNLYDKEYPCRLKEALKKEGVRSFAEGGSTDDFTPLSQDELKQYGLNQAQDNDFTPLSDDELQQGGLHNGRSPRPSSTAGSYGRGLAEGILPAAAAIHGAVIGSTVGAGIGALGGPAAPFTVPIGEVAGGLGGAYLGAEKMQQVQDWFLDKLGLLDKEQRQADEEQHPYARMAGNLTPNLLTFNPSAISRGLASRVVPGAVGAGVEAAQEKASGEDLDVGKIAIAGGAGALLNEPTKLGRRLMSGAESATNAAMSRLPQATQDAIRAGKARAGDYWSGKAQEGQPGRPDLKSGQLALPAPPDFVGSPEGVSRYGEGTPGFKVLPPQRGLPAPPDYTAGEQGVENYQPGVESFNQAEAPMPGSKAEQTRPIYERPYKPRPGTAVDNTPSPEDVPQNVKTPDTIQASKQDVTPFRPVGAATLGTAHEMARPSLTVDIGNNVNPPSGSQRDYRATMDSNVHPTSSGAGDFPTATVGDPTRANISPEIELALTQNNGRGANDNTPNAPRPGLSVVPEEPQPIPSGEEGEAFNRSIASHNYSAPTWLDKARDNISSAPKEPDIIPPYSPDVRKAISLLQKWLPVNERSFPNPAIRQNIAILQRGGKIAEGLAKGILKDWIDPESELGGKLGARQTVRTGAPIIEHEPIHEPSTATITPPKEVMDIAQANVMDMVAKSRKLGMNKLADAIEANPVLADKVRGALNDPAALRDLSALVNKQQQEARARAATEQMQVGQAKRAEEKPYVPMSQNETPSEANAQRREAEGQVAKVGDETVTTDSQRKATLVKRAADAAQSAFDKFATGKMGFTKETGYAELSTRLRQALDHAQEENLGVDPLKPMPRKRTQAQEWLKAAKDLVGSKGSPKTISPSKAVKFMGDERMLRGGAKAKEVAEFKKIEGDIANNRRRMTPEMENVIPDKNASADKTVEAWTKFMDNLSPEDRAEWENNQDWGPPSDHGSENEISAGIGPEDFEAEATGGKAPRDLLSHALDEAKGFFGNEDGSLNLQRLIQSARGLFGTRAWAAAKSYIARSPKSARQEYARSLDDRLMTVRKQDENTRVEDLKEARAHPEAMKDARIQDQVYLAREAGKINSLPQNVRDYYNQYLKPVFDMNDRLFSSIEQIAPGTLGPKVQDHIYRIAKGLHPDYGGDPIAGIGPTRGMTKTASMLKNRQFYVIEDAQGNRTVVSPTDTGYAEWHNGNQQFRQNANFEPKVGETFRDQNGIVQTVKEALTPEIEAHGRFNNGARAEYYHNAIVSAYETHAYLSDVLRHHLFFESLKADNDFNNWSTTDGKLARDRGWKQTIFPQLNRYYMANQLRYVFDDYSKPGLGGDALDKLRSLSHAVTKLLFWNPVPHLMNVATHWATQRGWNWVKPEGYRNLATTSAQAINSVMNQDHIQTEMRNMGAGTVYGSVITANFLHELGSAAGMAVTSNPSKWDPIARVLGMSTNDLSRAIYRGSSKIMWAGNDMMLTQAYLENKARGMSPRDALVRAEQHIPNYRIPTTILTGGEGGRVLSQFMQDPLALAFGRYHYAIFNSYAHMVKDLVHPDSTPEQRVDSIGKLMALGVLGFAIYPKLDQMAQYITGNKDASMQRRGPTAIPSAVIKSLQGKQDPMQAARNTFTISPTAATALETLSNRDWAGRNIVEPGQVARTVNGPTPYSRVKAGANVATQFGEHLARGLVAPYGTFAQAMDAKRNPLETLRDQVTDIRNPSGPAANYERTAPQKNLATAINREARGHGPAERFLNKTVLP